MYRSLLGIVLGGGMLLGAAQAQQNDPYRVPGFVRMEAGERAFDEGLEWGWADGVAVPMALLERGADPRTASGIRLRTDAEWPQLNGNRLKVKTLYVQQCEMTVREYAEYMAVVVFRDLPRYFGGDTLKYLQLQAKRAAEMRPGYAPHPKMLWQYWRDVWKAGVKAGVVPTADIWKGIWPNDQLPTATEDYFGSHAYDSYPMVGLTQAQMEAYAAWRTERVAEEREARGKAAIGAFRLPTEAEWMVAAGSGTSQPIRLATGTLNARNSQQQLLGNGQWERMGKQPPAKAFLQLVGLYGPTALRLYDLAGNAAELTSTPWQEVNRGNAGLKPGPTLPQDEDQWQALRVVKGGSFADDTFTWVIGSRGYHNAERGDGRVGFRLVYEVAE